MDAKKIGNTIYQLRKHNSLTQMQLADKLYVSDKAVSKWEQGVNIPDLQQIEAICKLFEITYDDFLNGTVKLTNKSHYIKKNKESIKTNKIKDYDSSEWYKLDNAAKVYPPQASGVWNMVFRIGCVLKENIDINVMQMALEDLIPRFPTFMVTLRRGLFWYYFERLQKKPKIETGIKYASSSIPLTGSNYLFRVSVDGKRVAVDFFHSLTDGTGASIFVMSLVARYYELKYEEIKDYKTALCVRDRAKESEMEDSFSKYAKKDSFAKREIKKAYHLGGGKAEHSTVTHIILEADKIYNVAKEHNGTVTEFLTALLIKVLDEHKKAEGSTLPCVVQVPVNLRTKFPSSSLRNFAYFAVVENNDAEGDIKDLIADVSKQIKYGTDKDELQKAINANVRDERNFFIKRVPLLLKNIGISLASRLIGDVGLSMSLSNLGVINAPDEFKNFVDRFEFVLKDPKKPGFSISVITYNNRCVISINRSTKEAFLEMDFVKMLNDFNLNIIIESNGGK